MTVDHSNVTDRDTDSDPDSNSELPKKKCAKPNFQLTLVAGMRRNYQEAFLEVKMEIVQHIAFCVRWNFLFVMEGPMMYVSISVAPNTSSL